MMKDAFLLRRIMAHPWTPFCSISDICDGKLHNSPGVSQGCELERGTAVRPLHSWLVGAILVILVEGGALLSDSDPITLTTARQRRAPPIPNGMGQAASAHITTFNRPELTAILGLYGRKVAAGDWRDYAIDLLRDKAVFSVFRKSSEYPLYRIEKDPRLARKQGAFSVIAAGGLIMKRGHDLQRVLDVLEDRFEVVTF